MSLWSRWRPAACFFSCAFTFSIAARAADPGDAPVTVATEYSSYEREAIDKAIADLHTRSVDSPEGKVLEGIDVVTLDVIEDRDPYPNFANIVHVTTKPHIIEREVLITPGDRWQQTLVDETARNLRVLPQLSVVLCVPVRGSDDSHVRLLIITKDLWSLRLTTDFSYTAGGLEDLLVQLEETNLFGRHQSVGVSYEYDPETNSFGARFAEPRLFGSRLALTTNAGMIFNRHTGEAEGSVGAISLTRPLFSTQTEWAASLSGSWDNEILRRFSNAAVAQFAAPTANGDAPPPGSPTMPDAYRSSAQTVGASVTRSFGWRIKNDATLGYGYSRRVYSIPGAESYDPALVAAYSAARLPTTDTRSYPYLQYHGYTNDFLRVLDFERLGLQEDFSLGHNLFARVYPVTEALGSTRTFLGAYVGAQYTVPLGDGLARASIESRTESEKDRLADASITSHVRFVTPRLGFGRIVYDAEVLNRYRNYLNTTSVLGGDTRLRGWPTGFFFGNDVIVSNLEFRTRPVRILETELGGAVFYDVGDAFRGFSRLRPHESAGLGLRVLFPQFNRSVLRLDVAFPFEAGGLPRGVAPASFFASFDQAFGVPTIGP